VTGIDDYAIIGDCRSAALIARDGTLAWLCWPQFDSPSVFAAILDTEKGGRFSVGPATPSESRRRYVGDTNVLETTFRTSTGVLRLTDLMPVLSEADKRRALQPQHEVLRRVACVEGEVTVDVTCSPRPAYATLTPRLRHRGRLGIACEFHAQVFILRSDIPLELSADATEARGRATLQSGETRYVSLVFAEDEPVVIPALGAAADRRIDASLQWWADWAKPCSYDGPYRDAVVRSALTLKLMIFAPSGAVIAAPTTSLPEQMGGSRNWDYRYCWLRDASLTLQALYDLGFTTEAGSFLSWLIHTTRISWPALRVLYDIYGRHTVSERELPHLSGFSGSRPVRIGNAAARQTQLDVYGEVIDAAYQFVSRGGHLDRTTARMLVGFGRTVCRSWREPDAGIWEIRSAPRHHTYSKAMCWVALDRLLRLQTGGHVTTVPTAEFEAEREAIRTAVERRGFNERLGSYVSVFDGADVDASLLQLDRHGYVDPMNVRMRGTLHLVLKRLQRNGLLYRYLSQDDGVPGAEGAFGVTSFWGVGAQARAGEADGARTTFEQLIARANDVGLFAEEIDPETGAALGNFPQAFTHVGLIDAALTLASRPADRSATADTGSVGSASQTVAAPAPTASPTSR